ncbi:hypothetical protein SCLCIDRAFT_1208153 [Scleroderma citrinum Foug A]|uniref:Uncharacterized protein n=1 Tax=Scleroderma citrinum Foug A TaxID=1036808 RepID=A0A0C3ENA8_9AGAM|nr:hypothetical protein SCLCIDRAFT_1208153 [Scleroderma citrinum Foug A]
MRSEAREKPRARGYRRSVDIYYTSRKYRDDTRNRWGNSQRCDPSNDQAVPRGFSGSDGNRTSSRAR